MTGTPVCLLHDRAFWITLSLTFLYVMGIYLATWPRA